MNLKEAVAVFALVRATLETKQEELSKKKLQFEVETKDLVKEVQDLKDKLALCFTEIDKDIKSKFEEDNSVKKFYGGFGIQEKKKIEYLKDITCDRCGSKIAVRTSTKTGKQFGGCSAFPKCKRMFSLEGEPIEFKRKRKK